MTKNAFVSAALVRFVQNHRRSAGVLMGMLGAMVAALLILGLSERPAAAQSEPQTVGRVAGLTATAAGQPDGTVRLTWNAAENAQVHFIYYIERKELYARNWAAGQMRAFNGTEATIDGLVGGETYYFAARGMRWDFGEFKAVWGEWVYWETATPTGTAVAMSATPAAQSDSLTVGAVTGLAATVAGQPSGTVRLTWNAAENAQVHFIYYIERKELYARNWAAGQMRAFNGTEATIDGLVGGETYYFAARGMRWDFGEFKAVWGKWAYWETATPALLPTTSPTSTPSPTPTPTPLPTATPQTPEALLNFPWLADGVTEDERRAVNALRNILREAPAVAETLLGFPWLANGVTEHESLAILHLQIILREDPATAETLLGFLWLADGVTRDEMYALYGLREILRNDPAVVEGLLESSWLADGVSGSESWAFGGFGSLYEIDRSSLSTLITKPWFKDGLTNEEFMLVGNLGTIAYRSQTDALAIMGMPFLETFEPADALAVRALDRLAYCWDCSDNETGDEGVSKRFRRVMAHPTISDGINDEETKVVATLFSARLYNPDILDPLLDPDTVTLEERTIDLPHTGETQLTIIRIRPGAERTMDLLERAVRDVEGFMATPLPVRHVIYLSENTLPGGAGNWFSNMTGRHKLDTDEHPEVWTLHVFVHETAHYYWYYDWSRHWIAEGLATFFQSLARRQATVGPGEPVVPIWPPHLPPCPIIHGNIAELERLEDDGAITYCSDSLGERLFQDLWRTLGDSVFRQGLANLYLTARSGAPVGGCEDVRRAGMCQVEAAFKSAAPVEAAATVDKVIGRWYDNSEPYDNSHVDASPPNSNLPGGVKITGAYISLDRDRREETRTDSFSASEIRERVFLHLHFSSSTVQPAWKLPLTFVEYFEDGFAYKINDATYTRNAGWTQNSLSFPIGAGPGYTWAIRGDVEIPTWAPGRHWVYVYHEGQKVAEVEFQVTP